MTTDNKILNEDVLHEEPEIEFKRISMTSEIWRDFKKNKGSVVGLILLILILIVTIVSGFIFDYETQVVGMDISNAMQHPSISHPFGTDQYGRDIAIRILYGARYSLSIGFVAVILSVIIGSSLGIVAGYYGGILESVIMRIMDIINPIPSLLLAIIISSAFGQGILVLMIAIGVVSVPQFARIARAAVMTVRDQEYIEAARASGAKEYQIIISHIVPNSLSPIIVQGTNRVAAAIITASSLSFLGLGVPTPIPEWGSMLSEGRLYIRDYSYMTLFPGLAIALTVLSINLIGDGLRDAMDPRLKR